MIMDDAMVPPSKRAPLAPFRVVVLAPLAPIRTLKVVAEVVPAVIIWVNVISSGTVPPCKVIFIAANAAAVLSWNRAATIDWLDPELDMWAVT